jgi:hypothetical protein
MRRAEHKWRKSRLEVFHLVFLEAKSAFHESIRVAKKEHIESTISEQAHNPKKLWTVLNSSLGRKHVSHYPHRASTDALVEEFNTFFVAKINRIQATLPIAPPMTPLSSPSVVPSSRLTTFSLASQKEVERVIRISPTKSESADPLPTWLLKQHLNILLPPITAIVNRITSSIMPPVFKHAVIRPLLKKPNLDPEDMNNYRPISGLPFLSKIVERIVVRRLNSHLEIVNGLDPHQSAYRSHHSCETALVSVFNNVLLSADAGMVSILTLLDLSSAFDTVNWDILTSKLSSVSVCDHALRWLSNYLSERSQSVSIHTSVSSPLTLTCGVPQGSVLGPILFSIYLLGIADVFSSHGFSYTLYADDIQFTASCTPNNLSTTLHKVEACVLDIQAWLMKNQLVLNTSKTEVILLGSRHHLKKCKISQVSLCGTIVPISTKIRDLGVLVDSHLTMDAHVSRISSSAFSYLHVISRLSKSLSTAHRLLLIHSLVVSRLNFCAPLLIGITSTETNRLQRILNSAMRIAVGKRKFDSIHNTLQEYEWLSVPKLLIFRTASLIYSVMKNGKPTYLSCLLVPSTQTRSLRSSDQLLLNIPHVQSTFGERAFSRFAPTLWNSIPLHIKQCSTLTSFQNNLKMFLMENSM